VARFATCHRVRSLKPRKGGGKIVRGTTHSGRKRTKDFGCELEERKSREREREREK
jgi:hypothetical protein